MKIIVITITANVAVRALDNIISIIIAIEIIMYIIFFRSLPLFTLFKTKGNNKDNEAELPAGLSKGPVIFNVL